MKIDRDAWRRLHELPRGARLVLVDLLVEADWRTGVVRESIRSLAQEWGIPWTTLRDHVRELIDAGEVERRDEGLRIVRHANLTGMSGEPPTADQGERSTAQGERSAAQSERSTAHVPAETGGKEGRRSTYDDDPSDLSSPTPDEPPPPDVGNSGGDEEASSQPHEPTPVTHGAGVVPAAWRGTGSWERTISRHLDALGADEAEREEVGERLYPRFRDGLVKPSREVVEEELRRVREEGERDAWTLVWFEHREAIEAERGPEVARLMVPSRLLEDETTRRPPSLDTLRRRTAELFDPSSEVPA